MSNEVLWDSIVHALALAVRLEDEGQYNNAKLLRATAESALRGAAYDSPLVSGEVDHSVEFGRAIRNLETYKPDHELLPVLRRGYSALCEGRLPLFDETPDVYVCRTCGFPSSREPQENCPTCSARPRTFIQFRPVYWLSALDPFRALEYLRSNPEAALTLLAGFEEEAYSQPPSEGGWSMRQIISHLRDAEGVLNGRVKLMLKEENPTLESLAVFEWATEEEDRPITTMEAFESYRSLRNKTLEILEAIPLKDWWRTGQHEEFGQVTVGQQASYFAVHELTHLPQLEALSQGQK